MADKAISELIAANQVTPTDLFVLEQSGTAKKLTGQILENWLVSFADGHGGIQSIVKASTSGLVDTYRITLADTTTFDFKVTNGKSVNSIAKTSTSGLVDTYTIQYNDSTTSTFTVTNGAKGDKGDNQYVWIKYASQKPTASSHSFGDVPDNWIGVYSGASDTAPTDWQEYSWFQIKGEKGDTGAGATVISNVVEYQVGDSGTVIPSGAWGNNIPVVAQGQYLWTRTTTTFNSGSSAVSYSVSRMGLDGTGSVVSVANISPDENGNVPLTAEHLNALSKAGGTMAGGINMNGQTLNGLNAPTADDDAATKGYIDNSMAMDMVWENEFPSLPFTTQTLALDISAYKRFLVLFKVAPSSAIHTIATLAINTDSSAVGECYANDGILVVYRGCTAVAGTGFNFAKCTGMHFKQDGSNTLITQNTENMVPMKIYGIR